PDQAKADYQKAIALLQPDRRSSDVRGRLRAVDRRDLGIAHQNLGNLLLSQGQFNEALGELGQAIVQFQRLVEDYPTRPTFQKYLANSFNSLASIYAGRKDLVNAEKNWHEAREILAQLVQTFPENGEYQKLLALTLSNHGWLRYENKDWPAARD